MQRHAFGHFDLEAVGFIHVGRQPREALPATATDAQQEHVAVGLTQHAADAGAMLAGIEEHHQGHGDGKDLATS